ncbi:MAG TPA: hypothetical protein VLW85_08725, partial [Myxococcales bacterium]|nr:hypothetical protein [Myxococcales bacterium]
MRRVFAALLVIGCSYRTPYQEQRSYADTLKPANVRAGPADNARVLRVRALVDGDYQSETPRWEQHISAQVDRASDVLAAQFGVRLELESARPWSRTGPLPHLEPAVEQLAKDEKGDGVDWVIGFVGSLAVFSAAQDQLGVAGLFGKHLVLRAMSSAAELDALNEQLKLLSGAEREELARERRLHKETAVLLHEWAHTLGAIHDRAPDTFMAPAYDKSQATFSPASAELVRLGLKYRGVAVVREAWLKAYRELLTGPGASYWDTAERDHALEVAAALLAPPQPKPPPETPLSPQDAKQLEQVALLEKAGDLGRAQVLLGPLADRNPRSTAVQAMACALLQESGAAQAAMLAACARAADLPGAAANVLLLTAQLRLASGDARGA